MHKEYNKLEDGVKYKIQSFGEDGTPPSIGEYVSFSIKILNDRYEEIYKTDKKGIDKFEHFIYTHNKYGVVQRSLIKFQEGDSISFVMHPDKLQEQFPFVILDSISEWYQVELMFNLMEKKAERDNRLKALLNQAMLKEEVVISNYFDRVGGRQNFINWGGMHLNIIKQGVKPKRNDNLDISYRAYFLDGRLLDTTSDSTRLKYSFGEKAQVIDGLNRVISKIGAGGKAEVIIPSILAFGDKGSSSKLVPPSTPLLYVVSIQKDSTAVKI